MSDIDVIALADLVPVGVHPAKFVRGLVSERKTVV